MELLLKRTSFTEKSTIGQLYINGDLECDILEDKVRGLKSTDTLESINERKVHGKTAIPTGRYQIAITFSDRFQKYLPMLIEVKGYAGVRIHPGNKNEDTEGCLLPGKKTSDDFVSESRDTFANLFKKLKAVEKKEKIYITIQ